MNTKTTQFEAKNIEKCFLNGRSTKVYEIWKKGERGSSLFYVKTSAPGYLPDSQLLSCWEEKQDMIASYDEIDW